jgi:hypothetical protein
MTDPVYTLNNLLQVLVLHQYLNSNPTVIPPGSLRYISCKRRSMKAQPR